MPRLSVPFTPKSLTICSIIVCLILSGSQKNREIMVKNIPIAFLLVFSFSLLPPVDWFLHPRHSRLHPPPREQRAPLQKKYNSLLFSLSIDGNLWFYTDGQGGELERDRNATWGEDGGGSASLTVPLPRQRVARSEIVSPRQKFWKPAQRCNLRFGVCFDYSTGLKVRRGSRTCENIMEVFFKEDI